MKTITLQVKGMGCSHCERRIESAVKRIKNVIACEANVETETLKVTYEGEIDLEALKRAIESEGYELDLSTSR
ncbi:MAG: heavy-metal-associated domain-containing protein [Desulfobacterota bacterium]|nr:heavy-metal-associated domain-containing protein [Thermodesulfobacteriota bacterium]MDW8001274.1 heavy metal-associated domain-containing protein [Deltaproteobacteria bacterium]